MTDQVNNKRPIRTAAASYMEGRTLSRSQATMTGKLQLKAELYVEHNRSHAAFHMKIARKYFQTDLVISSHRRQATKELKSAVGLWMWLLSPFIRALVWALVEAILEELFSTERTAHEVADFDGVSK